MKTPMRHGVADIRDGQQYSPYRSFNCVPVPVSLLSCPAISQGAKLLFGRLMLYAGENAKCWPSNETLAADLGVDVRTIRRSIKELVTARFIERRRTGRAGECVFTWNPLLTDSISEGKTVQPIRCIPEPRTDGTTPSYRPNDLKGQNRPSEGTELSVREGTILSPTYKESEAVQVETVQEASEQHSVRDQNKQPFESLARPAPASEYKTSDGTFDRTSSSQLSGTGAPVPSDESIQISEYVSLITGSLRARHIKIPSENVVAEMVRLAAEQGISPLGLIRFIEFKCEKRSPETTGFFLKSIPEDMPNWAKKNGSRYPLASEDRTAPTICQTCDDSANAGHDQAGSSVPCDCEAGALLAESREAVYSVAQEPCHVCLATLRAQSKIEYQEGRGPKCAFCLWRSGRAEALAEDPAAVTARLGAVPPAADCEICSLPTEANLVIVRENWESESEAAARYCSCRWGEYQRLRHQSRYPEEQANIQRNWLRNAREVDETQDRQRAKGAVRMAQCVGKAPRTDLRDLVSVSQVLRVASNGFGTFAEI